MTLSPAAMLAALNTLGAHYDPDNTTTATSDYDGPEERCIAEADLLAMADEAEARWTRWREGAA